LNSTALRLHVLVEPAEEISAGLPASHQAARLVTAMTADRAPAVLFPDSLRKGVNVRAASIAPAVETNPATQPGQVRRGGRRFGLRSLAGCALTALAVLGVATLLFLSVGPMLLPFQVFSVLSGSMEPGIPTGSLVVVTRVTASDVKIGDIITFQPPGRTSFVTHRVVTLDSGSGLPIVSTKGDANPAQDPWTLTLRGSGWRYYFSLPLAGYFLLAAQSPFGRLALVLVPGLGLALMYLLDEMRARRRLVS
jgi:signal peptidase